MADQATRQHYKLATGDGLSSAPSKNPSPGFSKGGKVGKSKSPGFRKGGKSRR